MELLPSVPLLFRVPLLLLPFLCVMVALGNRFLRLLSAPTDVLSPEENGLVSLALGTGLAQFLPYTLAAVGQLSVFKLRLVFGGLALLLLPDAVRVIRRCWSRARDLLSRPISRVAIVWLALLVLLLSALFVRGLIVSSITEDDGYHITAPKRWLQAGSLAYLPTYTHTNAPMGFEMLYMIALVFGGAALAKSLHLVAGVMCLLGVFLLAKRLGYRNAGPIAISCMLFENRLFDLPVLLNQIYVDLPVCWMMLSALVLWRVWCDHPDRRLLACSALCAGFAGSFKFIALSIGGALAVLVFLELTKRRASARDMLSSLGLAGLLSAGPVLPWLWRNWRLTGNPVYPMFSGAIPTRDWSSKHAKIFERFFRFYNWEPALPLNEAQRKEALFVVAALVIVTFAIGIWRVKQPALRQLLIFALLLVTCAFGTTGLYLRFLLPTLFCAVLIITCLCCERWPSERGQLICAVVILAVALAKVGRWARRDVPDALLVTAGFRPELRDDPFWNAFRYVNEHTPESSRVLIGAFCPSFGRTSGVAFWVDRVTLTTDSHLQDFISMNDWASFSRDIEKAHVDFVIVADAASSEKSAICSDSAFFPEAKNEYRFVRRLADHYGVPLFESGGLRVYRLARSPISLSSVNF